MNSINFANGGREIINRAMMAYGFNSRSQLASKTGITNSTLGTWWNRDSFPSNLVIQCAIDTGVSLKWLVTGKGDMFDSKTSDQFTKYDQFLIQDDELINMGTVLISNTFQLSQQANPILVSYGHKTYVVVKSEKILDGDLHLVKIGNGTMLRQLFRIDADNIRVIKDQVSIDHKQSDIQVLGRVIGVISEG